jgi:glucose/arabinose dehydrogenase
MPSMLRRSIETACLTMAMAAFATPGFAQLTATPFVSGLTSPVGMVQDPSDPAVQYVVEQGGLIKVIRNGAVQATPFIDLTAESVSGGERGLLGLAFPSDYARSGRFYVYFTTEASGGAPVGASVVSRFKRSTTDPMQADKTTRFDLLWPAMSDMHSTCASMQLTEQRFVCQPYSNHNGGKIAFGPDGYLYIGFGDGGSGGDPENQAQRPNTVLGKMVRIDVSVPDNDNRGYRIPVDNPFVDSAPIAALHEIWSFGLRNPWRFTFDDPTLGGTGAMTIGDVGQGAWEEIDYEPALGGGRNYGWRLREGRNSFTTGTAAFLPLTEPVHEYGDAVGNNGSTSITGGAVYRGTTLGAFYQGRYFYADYISGRVFSIALTLDAAGEATASGEQEHSDAVNPGPTRANISSIDTDFYGEIYLVKYSGQIVKLTSLGDGDLDNDGLLDEWELRYGLDPLTGGGSQGGAGDADGDGIANSVEFSQNTHPNAAPALTRYLAEGATSTFFGTSLALANPGTSPARALLRFLKEGGAVVTRPVTVPAKRRLTIDAGQLGATASASFATIVETSAEIVVERTMTWDQTGYGAHTEKAVSGPSSTWYFAEGAQGFFYTYLLLNNPTNAVNRAQVRWLVEGGSPVVQTFDVQPFARLTVDPGSYQELRDHSFGIEVTFQTAPGIAERAMYFGTPPDTLWKGGHESAGATAPALEWFLAEGATGPFFDTFVLVSNPGSSAANIEVTFFTSAGQTVTRTKSVPANSRLTVNIEGEGAPELANAAVATRVRSTNSVPVVVERAQYWPNSPAEWYEAHNSFGVTQPGVRWGLGEGEVGRARSAQTYILLANPNSAAVTVTLEFLREAGAPIVRNFSVPGNTRFNVSVGPGSNVPELSEERFGAIVSSTGPIVVERALYLNANGVVWSAGTNATGTPLVP